jgi:hypothetical protein
MIPVGVQPNAIAVKAFMVSKPIISPAALK